MAGECYGFCKGSKAYRKLEREAKRIENLKEGQISHYAVGSPRFAEKVCAGFLLHYADLFQFKICA